MSKKHRSARISLLATTAATLALLPSARAALFVKADNSTTLDQPASWTNNAAPGASDVAQWDNTVTSLNTTNTLGANVSWGGIRIVDPAEPVYLLTNSTGNTLTNGAYGIDMSAATADLTMSNNLALPDYTMQTWTVPSGRTLSLEGAFTRSGGAAMTFNNNGTINIAGGTASSPVYYSLINGTDVGALDASKNVSSVSSVLGYTGNVLAGIPSTTYCDVTSGNTGTADDVYMNTTIYFFHVIRFNTPQPNRNNWSWNSYKGQTELSSGANTILVTTNVGACDINFRATGSGGITMGWRQSSSELILDQENTAGALYFYNGLSQKNAVAGNVLTKRGAGRAVFNTSLVHTGPTRILEGELMVNAGSASTSVITVGSGATLSGIGTISGAVSNNGTVWAGSNGVGSLTISALTLNAGSALKFYSGAALMTNTTALLIITNSANVSGPVNVLISTGRAVIGQYPLIKSTSAFSGTDFANFNLASLPLRASGYLSNNTANSSIDLVITNINKPIKWAAGNGNWDIAQTANWRDTFGNTTTYQEANGVGDAVVFDDSASGSSPISITLNTNAIPDYVTVNASKNYTISGSGSISGTGSLTKSGSGTLTLATANAFTGGININGGAVGFSALTNLGGGPISFGAGSLRYAPGTADDVSVLPMTFNAGGATIDNGGNSIYFANPIGNSGPGGLTMIGSGSLTLNGTNRYTGNTVINQGTLLLWGNTYISNSAAIIVNSGAVLDAGSSGVGLTLGTQAGQILAGTGTVMGVVTVSPGTTISPATNGVIGTLTLGSDVTINGGALAMDVSTAGHDLITVGGYLTISAGSLLVITNSAPLTNGVYKLITYAGGLLSGQGSSGNLTIVGFSQPGKAATLTDTLNPNEIDLVIADTASDNLRWAGVGYSWDTVGSLNWSNGPALWAYTNGDTVTFDNNGVIQPTISLMDSLAPGSIIVSNDAANYDFIDGTGTGGGKLSGPASITKNGAGVLILETANVNAGPTVINNGTLQVGNGGGGNLGSGNVTNNSALVFGQSDGNIHVVSGRISGTGTLTQVGSSTNVLTANNSYSGVTTISSGTLQIGNGGATGTLGTNAIVNNSTLALNSTAISVVPTNISGSGNLRLQAANVKTLTALNQYQGNTYIDNGTLMPAGPNLIPNVSSISGSTGWLILDGGATTAGKLDLNGFNETANALAGLSGTVTGMITNSSTSSATNVLTVLGNAATTYSGVIAENASGSKVQLVLRGNSELRLNGTSTYSGGTLVGDTGIIGAGSAGALGTGSLTLSNGTTFDLRTSSGVPNTIIIPDNSSASFNSSSLGNAYAGQVTGGPTATNVIIGPFSPNATGTFQYGGFSGTVQIPTGGTLRFSSTTTGGYNGGTNTMFDLEGGVLQTRNAFTVYVGALEGASGNITDSQQHSGTSVFIIGTKNIDTTFSGGISGTNNIVKAGSAKLTLDGTLSYVGSTTVSNGVLVIGDVANNAVSLDNSPTINLRSSTAVLDVSGRSDSTLNLGNIITQTLSGFGTIKGSLNENAGSTVDVGGPSTGTLTVMNAATLNGAVNMKLNITNSPAANDELAANSISASGTLNVSNAGPNLVNGQTFKLFSVPVSGFTTITLPATDSTGTNNYLWQTNLAVDGTIKLIGGGINSVNTTPTNITFTVSAGALNLSWPADHQGWTLYSNAVSLTATNSWYPVAGSSSTTNVTITLDPTKTNIFFRMRYP